MTFRVLLVGCGNVGSRHLQALVKVPYDLQIDIIEPNKLAKNLGISRLEEISYNKNKKIITWHYHYDSKILPSDLTIVSTLSKGRANLLIKLMQNGHKRILSEKILCQSKNEYERIIKICKEKKGKIWINTNPRCFKSYIKIKKLLSKNKPIHFTVLSNPEIGLATNVIHYLDLFSWMNDDYDIKLDGSLLNKKLLPNKRGKDFTEFSGTITGNIKNNSIFAISFLNHYSKNVIVKLSNNLNDFFIDETNGTTLHIQNNECKLDKFIFEHVSTLTTKFVSDILKIDSCKLPMVYESYKAHLELYRIFNNHISKTSHRNVKLCPIT